MLDWSGNKLGRKGFQSWSPFGRIDRLPVVVRIEQQGPLCPRDLYFTVDDWIHSMGLCFEESRRNPSVLHHCCYKFGVAAGILGVGADIRN